MPPDRTKGHLELLLLAALADGPGHGYSLIAALRARTDGLFDLAEGSVYPALHRLHDLGLVASEWQPVDGRRRRVYWLTQRGAAALAKRRCDWEAFARAVDAVVRRPRRSQMRPA
jgi:PadR family transcriptional regulator, regulatory protein PadR